MKPPIRTQQDKTETLENIQRLRELAREKGYKFGTQYDDAEERLKAKRDEKS